MSVPVEEYIAHALRFTKEEEVLKHEFNQWLPENIIDCHAHSNRREDLLNFDERGLRHMISTFPFYSIADSVRIQKMFFNDDKKIRTLRFPKTLRNINHKKANEYLLEQSPPEDRIAIFGLPQDIEYTTSMLSHPRVTALKMYYSYVEPVAQTIYEIFKPEILEEAQHLDKPIILHVPKMIVRAIDDLEQMLQDFPKLRVSIAHLGSTKFTVVGLKEAYLRVAAYKNVNLDTSLNPSKEVVELAIQCFGSDRIMYGSDEPLHMIRSAAYIHPEKGQRIVSDYPYHWVEPDEYKEYGHLAKNVSHVHWQALGAIRGALESLHLKEQELAKQRIFHDNARDFFGF